MNFIIRLPSLGSRTTCTWALGLALAQVPSAFAQLVTNVWTGAGADANWTTVGNWEGGNAPIGDGTEVLVFGALSSTKYSVRANGGWDISTIVFESGNSSNYVISGLSTDEILLEALREDTGVINRSSALQTINTRIKLGKSQRFIAQAGDLLFGTVGLESFTLTIDTGSAARSVTLGNLVSGSGSIVKEGAGQLLLSGANTFASGVTLTSGTLVLGNDSAAGTGSILLNGGLLQAAGTRTIANNVLLGGGSFGGRDNIDLLGVVSGSGEFTKTGTGRLTLGNANTASGAAQVRGGELRLAANGALGSVSSVLIDNASLVLDAAGGDLVNNQASLTLSGGTITANSRTEAFGSLTLGSGANALNLAADNVTSTLTFENIVGTGSLTIFGWAGENAWGSNPGGTDDRIFVSQPVAESVLAKISFPGFGTHSTILPTGELIPVPEPGTIALLALGAVLLLGRLARRRT